MLFCSSHSHTVDSPSSSPFSKSCTLRRILKNDRSLTSGRYNTRQTLNCSQTLGTVMNVMSAIYSYEQ